MIEALPHITQWSYSTWQTYNQCPRKAFYKKVRKLQEPGSPQMERGTQVHQLAQDYVEGKADSLPEQAFFLAGTLDDVRANATKLQG